jgi:SAM-dependent methyltransferase
MEARTSGRLSVVAKQAYYDGPAMPPQLARGYWRRMPDARVVLDVGCGAGDFGRLRPSQETEVHGVDNDAIAVQRALSFERAQCVDLDAAPLPYADATFDAVLAKDIFEHVEDPGRLAREIHRVTRPGGVIVASMVMAKPHRVWADYTHRRGFTADSARMLLGDAGFVVEDVWRMGPVPLSTRLGLLDAVPALLRVPMIDALWGASWEVQARR